ncbi:Lrp/AsnC family transcriptional regulator [Saccharopolyspora mangrovi]|uniref:Lrp/AsnC family transcriptional regulator n=1 Tax=Saccharopolyspora mangrovi TaxID=3082379 RepID=A0ABU6ADM9_9PSEU|nr:Lrp/AsnC family transcriptional regulator [Saccharopolyspora sp. S2-29]MEB3369651.1 Lrp/AsnC family transcriptional regulator [Saccharopolyspora sp. S2-29]
MHSRAPELAEEDLALIHALQIAPRVSWAEAARVLDSSPTALAARWQRLRAAGLAWVTVHSGEQSHDVVAFVDLRVDPAHRAEAIERISRDPRAASVEETAGGRDLVLTVIVPDYDSLAAFTLDELPTTPGVRAVNTHVATKVHRQGADWRLDALDREQQLAVRDAARHAETPAPGRIPDSYWPVVQRLAQDGRQNAAEIARALGRDPATVRRQVARLLATDALAFRCEVAGLRSRWPIVCTWFAQVPMTELDHTVRSLSTLPELRLLVSTAGQSNLMFLLWARSSGDLMRIERSVNEKLPWLRLSESVLTLRTRKRMGWILDRHGRTTGELVLPHTLQPR